ncbi:MAG: sugar phosphate isomerase/epimerase [Rhizobiaceae bacterium]|nr:sugar phosphate isomerase/epimerase [Rhizobiaceae bacterium]
MTNGLSAAAQPHAGVAEPAPDRIVSVSMAPYDGYHLAQALASLASIGATHVEPAFIVGYTDPFTEDAFLPERAAQFRRQVEASGLGCLAMSSHMDLGAPGALEIFTRRMEFAAGIGARVIATNAAIRPNAAAFFSSMETLVPLAERLGIVIALENPGDGRDNVFNTAADGLELVARFGSPHVRLNYDAANTASHRPSFGDFAADAILALPASAHAHIKDLCATDKGWFFTPIGDGVIGCDRILDALVQYRGLPVSIEMPLRFHRNAKAQPVRREQPVPLAEIEAALSRSLAFVRERLGRNQGRGRLP